MLAQAGFQSRGRCRELTPVTPHYAPTYKAEGRSRPHCLGVVHDSSVTNIEQFVTVQRTASGLGYVS